MIQKIYNRCVYFFNIKHKIEFRIWKNSKKILWIFSKSIFNRWNCQNFEILMLSLINAKIGFHFLRIKVTKNKKIKAYKLYKHFFELYFIRYLTLKKIKFQNKNFFFFFLFFQFSDTSDR